MKNMPTTARRLRCAVYARKSTDEGMEREYNSIDAQRDGGANYIATRRSEGWIPVADDYDDAGYSGRDLKRPALQRLLADIREGCIDVVIVYKIDRLTRAMRDFPVLIDLFDKHKVTLVSITENFNTKDAVGRMTLNMMLTFGQFEREIAADRVRDKMVASKKKGLWMHGVPPLGYDLKDRRLAINQSEAKTVRFIFEHFAEHGSAIGLLRELRVRGATSKVWTTQAGRQITGKPIDKSLLYKVLANRTYLGELRHHDQWFPGAHSAIVTAELWDRVQARLVVPTSPRERVEAGKVAFPLRGLLVAADGRALTPWHTTKKNGRTYRYYLSTRALHEGAKGQDALRFPAAELEAAVVQQLRHVLKMPALLADLIKTEVARNPRLDEAQVTVAMAQVEKLWGLLVPAEQSRLLHRLVEKVVVSADALELRLRAAGVRATADEIHAPTEFAA
ncbi:MULTISPECIES: recombinase family protein [unclassified Lysobacter]|uniref:recombinase family protein n=1 Tax=unclassified Lysobacter TaxID=2635362 RepID=UPI001BEAE80A|nr:MULTISPECIES: recombinase family protein [unclassified Lysobacter]MBT2748283.1 recombinase family protein [Lysobacter sp. ISL-42]MBT2749950.1 recombinase family protein [Lysobacter sp. ISL-50]MBT2781278.1 recombinase family protein [Lysobacter sp. ISL-52]